MLIVRGQHHSFSTPKGIFWRKWWRFWDWKCSEPVRFRIPKLYIHAESSNLMSYRGRCFLSYNMEHWLWWYVFREIPIGNQDHLQGIFFCVLHIIKLTKLCRLYSPHIAIHEQTYTLKSYSQRNTSILPRMNYISLSIYTRCCPYIIKYFRPRGIFHN